MSERIYLVTGATGHLGTTLIQMLAQRRENIRALALPGDRGARRLAPMCRIFEGDVRDSHSLRDFFALPDGAQAVVLHCAGIVSIASRAGPALYDVNVAGVRNVLARCRESGVQKLVYVSSVHAIPERGPGEVIRETKAFSPTQVTGAYARTKAEATALVLAAARRGLPACVVHPSGMLGPNDYGPGHLTQMLLDYCRGRLFAGVHGGYDFVDVRDVAQGVLAAAALGESGECFILSNRFYSVEELFHIFHNVTGRREIRLFLPMGLARAAAPLAERYYRARRQPPLFTAYSLYTLAGAAVFSHEKATRQLGYATRPMEETVADTWAFLKKVGML